MNENSPILKSFREHISGFALFSDEDKSFWISRAEHLPTEIMVFLVRLFEESPEDIVKIAENVRAKEEILVSRDRARWEELLAKEKAHLESLS